MVYFVKYEIILIHYSGAWWSDVYKRQVLYLHRIKIDILLIPVLLILTEDTDRTTRQLIDDESSTV